MNILVAASFAFLVARAASIDSLSPLRKIAQSRCYEGFKDRLVEYCNLFNTQFAPENCDEQESFGQDEIVEPELIPFLLEDALCNESPHYEVKELGWQGGTVGYSFANPHNTIVMLHEQTRPGVLQITINPNESDRSLLVEFDSKACRSSMSYGGWNGSSCAENQAS
jgi:hypothetical protein